jgi:hypothetical protein
LCLELSSAAGLGEEMGLSLTLTEIPLSTPSTIHIATMAGLVGYGSSDEEDNLEGGRMEVDVS